MFKHYSSDIITVTYTRANGVRFELHITDVVDKFLYKRRSYCDKLNTTMLSFIDSHLLTFLDSTITDRKMIFDIQYSAKQNAYVWKKTSGLEFITNCNLWKNSVPDYTKQFVGTTDGPYIDSYVDSDGFATLCGKMREDSAVSINFSTNQKRRKVSMKQLSAEITDEMRNGECGNSNGCYNSASSYIVLDDYVVD
ncbi:hypothetical protein SNEBB_002471 [Seison nebaliae]|nr:hypothetical protein SNEBB_002471 [Seison nebaliae]